jgi:hypothetical protein
MPGCLSLAPVGSGVRLMERQRDPAFHKETYIFRKGGELSLTCVMWDDLFALELTSSCLVVLEFGFLTVMKSDRSLLLS